MTGIVKAVINFIRDFLRKKLHYKSEDLPYYITIAAAVIMFVLGLGAFVGLTEQLVEDELTGFDAAVTAEVVGWREEGLTQFLTFITHVGDSTGYFVVIAVFIVLLIVLRRSWKFVFQTGVVLLLATLSNVVLKQIINRARPDADHLVVVHSLSYPSGHAMSAMAFYGFLIFLTARYKMNYVLKVILILVFASLIFLIGLSRVYLGVHFPSDVIAGYIGGLIWVTFCAIVFDVIVLYRRRRERAGEILAILKDNAKSKEND